MDINEIQAVDGRQKTAVPAEDYKAIAVRWLESTGNLKRFTEGEKNQFIDICAAYGLNPIKKEVYGVKYGDSFNIIVSADFYRKRAERTGLLDGFNTSVAEEDGIQKAVCTIHRKDWKHPFIHEVYMNEYNSGKSLWREKPLTMLKKVAEAQAFRKCFPDELGGVPYTAEELPEEMASETPDSSGNELAEMKRILENSAYPDGTLVFDGTDKEFYRRKVKEIGAKKALEFLIQELSERAGKTEKEA